MIIDIVSKLVEKGYAYRAENGDVYFRTRQFDEYGKLSHQPIDDLESGARIAVGEVKEDPLDFALWKANANGVDLNVNFDAGWGEGEQNVYYPSAQNYVGTAPCSEAETQALVEFTQKVAPLVTLSYHCKGEVVYWYFGQTRHRKWRDQRYANAIASYTGYTLVEGTDGSAGGYKDWCIKHLRIPSYTIEVGGDSFNHPFPYSQFEKILGQNLDLPRKLLNSVVKDYDKLKAGGLLGTMDLD
jgi:hypothetical protein